MKIWLIQTGEPLPLSEEVRKMRTAVLADKLITRGHEVLWWGSAFDHLTKKWVFDKDTELSTPAGLKIIALKGMAYTNNVSLSRFVGLRIISRKFRRMASNMVPPDIILAATPSHDLSYEAVVFAARNKVPIIVDIRDEWPDSFINYTFMGSLPMLFRKFIRLLLYKDFVMIRKTMQQADGLTSMMDSLLEWGLCYAGRPRTWMDRVFYLGYKKESLADNGKNKIARMADTLKGKFVVTFIGTFGICNNPMMVLDCARLISDRDICIVLAGDGDLFSAAQKRISDLNISNVLLTGWLNQAEISMLLKYSHVGLSPTSHMRTGFPNKIFTYFSEGIPVISAWEGELKNIIDQHRIGFNCLPNDSETMSDCINKLYNDRDLYNTMSSNVQRLFQEMFDANRIYEDFSRHIESVQLSCKKSYTLKKEQKRML